MRPMYILIAVGLLICGCQGTGPAKIDNPVVGPPPPRLPPEKIQERQFAENSTRISVDDVDPPQRLAAKSIDDDTRSSSGIQRVSLSQTKDRDLPAFEDGMVVALVNDHPIFAGEVLAPIRPNLKKAEQQMKDEFGKGYKPEMMHRLRAQAILANLPRIVERKMLVLAAMSAFKKQQLEGLSKSLDSEWEQQIEEMMRANKVTSINELDELLKENDYDLEEHKAAFKDQQIAMQYVSFKAHSKFEPTRKELLTYYEEHLSDYEFPARVHWQQLVISDSEHGGEAGAKKVLDDVVKKLVAGADFGETIKKYGDGPKASNSGIWDWTVKGSLANKEVEKELFTLPVGDMSGVIRTATGFQIVQVIDRQEAGRMPFETKQKEIEEKLKANAYKERAQKVIEEIKESAVIKTVFDGDTVAAKEDPEAGF